MKQLKPFFGFALVFLITLILTGCGAAKTTDDSRRSMIQTVDPAPTAIEKKKGDNQDIAEDVKKEVRSLPEIFDVAVIKGEEEILVAYKVKHMQRFYMKKIEKKLKQKLERKYPKENFIVSSDYKIFIEALELKERLKDKNFSPDKAEEKLKKIIKLQKELT